MTKRQRIPAGASDRDHCSAPKTLSPDAEVDEPHRGGAEARREFHREEGPRSPLARVSQRPFAMQLRKPRLNEIKLSIYRENLYGDSGIGLTLTCQRNRILSQ